MPDQPNFPAQKILVLWNHPDDDDSAGDATTRACAAHMAAVVTALQDAGFRAAHVNVADDIDRIIDSVVVEQPALIYNLVDSMYGDYTQHGAVASLYELLGIPYTGSDPLCLASAALEDRARTLLGAAELPVSGAEPAPESRLLHVITYADPEAPPLPITESHFAAEDEPEIEPPATLVNLDADLEGKARDMARRAFFALGCRDAAQIDLSLEAGELAVLEVCPVIDLAPGTPFAVAADASDRGFAGAITDLVRLGLARTHAARAHTAPPEPAPADGDAGDDAP